MARRKAKHKIDKKVIVEAFTEMAKHKSIDRDLLQGILEETLSMIIRKKYGQEANFEIIVNMEKGDIEIYLMREIVELVEDDVLQISLEEARKYSEEPVELGDDFIEEITLDNIADSFGRRLVTLASQNLNQRIRDVEKDNVYREYAAKVGEIIVGEIYQIRRHDLLVMHNKIEMRLTREEQIPNEPYKYKKNQTIKAIVKEVKRHGVGGQPEIILSRASNEFLAKLFEIEIPEIYDGIIQIKSIARDPGERSKVAVVSYDDRVDPVGACVGMKGIRIHSIVRELNNENIDLIEFSDEPAVYISRSLSPAKVIEISVDMDTRTANVIVSDDQVALAVGKSGQNVRLASMLTGFNIILSKAGDEDIELAEFKAEFGDELFAAVTASGIETAREFLEAEPEEMLVIEGMTKDKLIELRLIILVEFDESESKDYVDSIKAFGK
ncbi:MAG: transcription termination factor NusA [Candidatus Kapabacteria bacterium]|nr:transcription termination factor NusA [Candidatus Kapabacteria bacterium]